MMEHQIDLDKILIKGAKYGNFDIVYQAIDQRANIHAQDDKALQWSAKNGHLEVVQQLFLQGKNNCSTRRQYLHSKY
jgi:hypothetical protein